MKPFIFLCVLFFTLQVSAQEKELATKNVTIAANNYIDTFYKADTTLAYKSVHKKLRKVGWWFDEKKGKYSDDSEMPFDKLISLSKRWNKKGDKVNESTPRNIEVLDVSDKIAVVKVTAAWGIDYLNMVNTNEGWQTINIVWQTKPKF
ncbi:nuclear transport factor 2 family protein [uncultured Lacinutrix sp.]|uniref:nuclear transport factor 2 family protein n=1 Tax=uncultured Lacinutrix sp. TaxID=574032 RepID=UPI002613BA50|nr:nuclear transport factor 2 family protein [uncultured Lacinutrix sp.]